MKLSIFYSIVFSFLIFNLANAEQVETDTDFLDEELLSQCDIYKGIYETEDIWFNKVYMDANGNIVEAESIPLNCREVIHQRTDTDLEEELIFPYCDIYEGIYVTGDNWWEKVYIYMDANGNIVEAESISPYCREEIDQRTDTDLEGELIFPYCDIYEGIYVTGDNWWEKVYMDANGNIVEAESISPYCREEIDQRHKRISIKEFYNKR